MSRTPTALLCTCVLILGTAAGAGADVLNMADGLTSLEFVHVGNPGNPADTTGYGAVDYTYSIGTCEVTTAQYVEFLNAVAATDTYGLYSSSMWSSTHGRIVSRSGSSGAYTYAAADGTENLPIRFVAWGSAARFVNWLTNGQPQGPQNAATTEDGSYTLNGATSAEDLRTVTRNESATYHLPTIDEWYKAAYHANTGANADYWLYPTASDDAPSNSIDNTGNTATYHDGDYTTTASHHLTEVGLHSLSPSAYQTFDQGGNLMEMTEALHWEEAGYVTMGGHFGTDGSSLQAGQFRYVGTTFASRAAGFRIVQTPEPASVTAMALAVFLVARKRRR